MRADFLYSYDQFHICCRGILFGGGRVFIKSDAITGLKMDGEGLLCSSELFIADAKMGGSLSHTHAFGRLGDGWRVASLEALLPLSWAAI